MILNAEFTTEPFQGEGEPPPHAVNARDVLLAAGLEPDFGPLGTAVHGDHATVLPALAEVLHSALTSGANRVTLQITVDDAASEDATQNETSPGEASPEDAAPAVGEASTPGTA